MSIKHHNIHYAVLALLFTGSSAYAECIRDDAVPAEMIDMIFGRVVVRPDLPVGSVIKERTWTMPETGKYWARCRGGTILDALIISPGSEGANKVFSTNIPGIGLRFTRKGQVGMTYPDTYRVPGGADSLQQAYLGGSDFTVEIIKTALKTGSGTIAQGEYTRYGYKPNSGITPAIISFLSAEAITIVSPSCLVTSGNNQDVYLPPVRYTSFSGKGTTVGEKPFFIKLLCSGGIDDKGYSNINITFDADLAPDTETSSGVLKNKLTDNNSAKGVGIQVLDTNNTPLLMKYPYLIGKLASQQEVEYNLNYIARYYQHGNSISPGDVQAKMIFNITYD